MSGHAPKKIAHSPLAPEPDFHWRGGEITRLEAFSDVVFGFAITLLVVSLEVPKSVPELMAALRGFVPFAACFAQVVMIWLQHYKFSRRFGLQDPWTIFLTMVLLFLVLFYVYPLKFVFTELFNELTGAGSAMDAHQASVVMRIYGIGFAAVFFLFALLYEHAYRLRSALDLNAVETLITRSSVIECAGMTVIGLLSFAIAFVNPAWAGLIFFLIGPFYGVTGTLVGKKLRRLTSRERPAH
ncbi:MAG TPA: TMEM175 family protein [Terriglobales bacterium]